MQRSSTDGQETRSHQEGLDAHHLQSHSRYRPARGDAKPDRQPQNHLADKDAQLKKAQQAATDAQAAADKAQAAASAQNQAVSDNAAAVNTLQSTVTDMKSANASAVASLPMKQPVKRPSQIRPRSITRHHLTPEASRRLKLCTAPRPPAATFLRPYLHPYEARISIG